MHSPKRGSASRSRFSTPAPVTTTSGRRRTTMPMRVFAAERAAGMVFLDAAASIGRDIAEQAVWDGARCNWVGAAPEEGRAGEVVMAYAALGPGLYDGTSGIALFLSHL